MMNVVDGMLALAAVLAAAFASLQPEPVEKVSTLAGQPVIQVVVGLAVVMFGVLAIVPLLVRGEETRTLE